MQTSCSCLAWVRLSAALLLLLLLTPATYAQFDTATVLGTIRDTNGAVVPNATVRIKNTATGIEASSATDAEGNYQFFNVKIGTYQVTAEAQGFARGNAENVLGLTQKEALRPVPFAAKDA